MYVRERAYPDGDAHALHWHDNVVFHKIVRERASERRTERETAQGSHTSRLEYRCSICQRCEDLVQHSWLHRLEPSPEQNRMLHSCKSSNAPADLAGLPDGRLLGPCKPQLHASQLRPGSLT